MSEPVTMPVPRDRMATDPAPVAPASLKPETEEGAMEAKRTRPAAGALRIPLGRRGWLLLGLGLLATGAALNWSWLAAIGLAPIILSLAPLRPYVCRRVLHVGRLEIMRHEERNGRDAERRERLNSTEEETRDGDCL